MKKVILIFATILWCFSLSAQFVGKMEVNEDIPGLCSKKDVYVIFPLKGQVEAKCPVSIDKIIKKLNQEVAFLKDHSNYNDSGMISLIINCKGEVVQCKMDNKTNDAELDKQIEAVFNSLGIWKAGKIGKKEVDTCKLYSFEIKDGKFIVL